MQGIPTLTIVRDDGLGDNNPTFAVDGTQWVLNQDGLENFDSIEHNISSQDYAQYDGAFLLNERSPVQDRTLECICLTNWERARKEAERFFIAGKNYELHFKAGNRRRYCAGRHYAFKLGLLVNTPAQGLTWTILCLEPYWLSEDEKRSDITDATGKRGFPFCSYVSRVSPTAENPEKHIKGYVVGNLAKTVRLTNAGQAEAYPRFEVSATSTVVNPVVKVVSASGDVVCSFGVDVTLEAGDVLIADFSVRPTTLTLNGENVSNKVTQGSTLASGIPVGDFTITWDADTGDASLSVVPSIRERYESI